MTDHKILVYYCSPTDGDCIRHPKIFNSIEEAKEYWMYLLWGRFRSQRVTKKLIEECWEDKFFGITKNEYFSWTMIPRQTSEIRDDRIEEIIH